MATKESNEVRNQLHTIQIENLTPAQIERMSNNDGVVNILDIIELVNIIIE